MLPPIALKHVVRVTNTRVPIQINHGPCGMVIGNLANGSAG